MSEKALYTGLMQRHVEVAAHSVVTLDYDDTKPNFFKVFNNSDTEVLCATSKFPTPKAYDFKIKAHSVKGYADIFHRNKLYLYNQSAAAAQLVIHSFSGQFDPSAYYMADFELNVAGQEVESTIQGFNSALPAGDNVIGKVSISGTPSVKVSGTPVVTIRDAVTVENPDTNGLKATLSDILEELIKTTDAITSMQTAVVNAINAMSAKLTDGEAASFN